MALLTRARVSAPVRPWPLMTRDTVPIETPAARATSWIVARGLLDSASGIYLREILRPSRPMPVPGALARRHISRHMKGTVLR